jgi:RNA polymerase sigma-70 factor (family 1)
MDNESGLLRRVAEDDQFAFRSLFDHYRDLIYSIAYKVLKDEALAEDTVQEVFVKLWLNKKTLPQIQNLRAYINTVTRNYLYNYLKRLALAEKYLRKSAKQVDKPVHSEALKVEFNELRNHLDRIVRSLPPQQRKVYMLGKEEGLKYEEIADRLQISKETVKTHMSEALKTIKREFVQYNHLIGLPFLPLLALLLD